MTTVSVIVLSMGDRPVELAAAIASARAQNGVGIEVVLVVNGGQPNHADVDRVVEPGTNLGIPGGRNAGVGASSGDLLAFLDDDAEFLETDLLAAVANRFDTDPRVGAVGLRLVDEDGNTARRHQPRVGATATTGPATSFPGGATVVRREAFEQVGGLCADYHYGLEETDLAWRLIDAGWGIVFDADRRVFHPRTDASRHAVFHQSTGRNRVWLAHRCLPLPLGVIYLTNWMAVTVVRNWRRPRDWIDYARGTMAGLRHRVGPRKPMRWRTAWTLTRLGRPPII